MRKAKGKWLKRAASAYLAIGLALTPAVSVFAAEKTQTEVCETVQDETVQDETVQGEAVQEEVLQDETVQDETAQEEILEDVVTEENIQQEAWAGYTGLVNVGGNQWRYQVNGVTQWNYTGLVKYYSTWYYVEKGVLNWNYTGLTKYYSTWYYVQNGVLNWNYTGLTKYYSTWYYVEKGVLNWNYTGLTKYYSTWYYVQNGVLNWNYTGLTKYYSTWYYVEKGVLNWNYTGFTEYYGTTYYVEKGVLNWNYKAHKLEDFLGTYCVNTNLRVTGYPMGNVDVLWLQVNNGVLQRVDRPFRNAFYQTEYYRYDSYKIEGDKLICNYSKTYDSFGNVATRKSGTDTYVITDSGDLIKGSDTLYRYDANTL